MNFESPAPLAAEPPIVAGRLPGKLDPDSLEARELLESLDDAMFEAIAGDQAALRHARELWELAAKSLDETQVDESREQYLRCAFDVTQQFGAGELRRPEQIIAAAEVISWITRDAA